MEQVEKGLSPSDVVGDWVRELRRQRGWTAKDLERECAKYGASDLTAASILNIETGRRGSDGRRRRNITIDELLVLSRVLSVAPVNLMFPPNRPAGSADEPSPIAVTPEFAVSDRGRLRRWVAGIEPLDDGEFFTYFDDADPAITSGLDDDRLREMINVAVKKELGQQVSDLKEVANLAIAMGALQSSASPETDELLAGARRDVDAYVARANEIISSYSAGAGDSEDDSSSEGKPSGSVE